MTEYEKMLAGEWYFPGDEKLAALRRRAAEVCFAANRLPPGREEERMELLRPLFGKTGAEFTITPDFHCDYGGNITLGEGFYANYNLVILDCAPVTFGDNVLVGPGCGFYTAIHPLDAVHRATGEEKAAPITVGSDVWFGGNVTVLPGVTIGDGAVIGAGSVVTRDIPPGVVAAGNPCRVLRPVDQEQAP